MNGILETEILFAGYYDENGKYIVEIDEEKLIKTLKKEFKADEIKFI